MAPQLPTSSGARRVALVTGGWSGIGKAIARRLGSMGYELVLASQRPEELRASAEEIAAAFGTAAPPLPVINRPGTIYGPGQDGSEESGWVAWFCRARDEGLPVTIHGDGTQTRDLLHVTDYCELVARQIAEPDPYFARRWDVGGGKHNAVSVLGLAQWLGLDYTFGPSRPGDAPSYIGYNDVPDWEPTVRWWESETLACMTNSPLLPS